MFKPFLQVTHALSSIVAALTAATMGTPADVIKTRIMNQPLDGNGKGKGISNHYQGFGIKLNIISFLINILKILLQVNFIMAR